MNKRKSLSERIEQATEVLDELSYVGDLLSSSFDNKELAYKFLDILDRLISVEFAGLYLWNEEEKKLELFVSKGFTEQDKIEAERTAMDRHVGWVYKNQEILNIPDSEKDKRSITGNRSFKVGSRVWIPVIIDGKSVGSFGLASSKKHAFNQNAISALNFVGKIAAITYFNIEYKKNLLAREGHLKDIIDGNLDAHILINQKGIIQTWNKNATEIFGWNNKEGMGKPITEIIILPEDIKKGKNWIKTQLGPGDENILDKRVRMEALTKDNEIIPIELIVTRLDYKGDVFFSGFIRDISLEREHLKMINSFAAQLKEEVANKTAEIYQLSTIPKQNPNPVIELSFSCELLFYNDAAIDEFPMLDSLGGDHPFCLFFKPKIKPILKKGLENDMTLEDQFVIDDKIFMCKIYLIKGLGKARFYLTNITERERHTDVIEKINKDLNDSISYAKVIQTAIFTKKNPLEKYHDSFLLYIPKNVVSGDFFWSERSNNNIVFCLADCTGHGVPGALMSITGHYGLNEAVVQKKLKRPDQILASLDTSVRKSLKTKGDSISDGMDIALCNYNPANKMIQYAGAYNPLLIIREGELIKLAGDKHSIGSIIYKDIPFSNHEFQLIKGDSVYVFSDGFEDQFGGKKDKRYQRKRFYNYLIEIAKSNPKEKYELLLKEFKRWKGDREQIDDVSVFGFTV